MKHILLISILALTVTFISAQPEFNHVWNNYSNSANPELTDYKLRDLGITEVYKTHIDQKGEQRRYLRKLDEKGRTTSWSHLNEDSSLTPIYKFTYHNSDFLLESITYKKNKVYNKTTYTRMEDGRPTLCLYELRGKLKNKDTWTYENGKLVGSESFIKGGNRLKYRWAYEYDSNGDLVLSTIYNADGSTKHKWIRSCTTEAESKKLIAKEIHTQHCQYEQVDSNHLVKIRTTVHGSGMNFREEVKYNLKDTSLVEITTYKDDAIWRYSIFADKTQRPLARRKYNQGMEVESKVMEYYNNQNIKVEDTNEDVTNKIEHNYDGELLTETKVFDKENKLVNTTKFRYK